MKKISVFMFFVIIFISSSFSFETTGSNVINTDNAKNIKLLEKLESHTGKVWRLNFCSNGLLASGGQYGKLIIWSNTDGKFEKKYEFKLPTLVEAVDFIDENTVVALSNYLDVRFYSVETGELIKKEPGYLGNIMISNDSRKIARELRGDIRVYDIDSGELIYSIKDPAGTSFEMKFTSDDRHMITVGHEGGVILWNLETGEKIRDYKGHSGDVHAVDISFDDKYILTGATDGKVKIWDIETGKCLFTMYHYDGLYDVIFSPDGKIAASVGCDMMVNVWNVETGRKLKSLHHKDEIHTVSFSPDGKYIAAGGYDGDIYIWGLE